ncbi:transposase [Pseudomonas fluorescens]|uniref:transposase n=1 Tax=Pseudomonas fluorescens TaxID=294 RepID=UPI001FCFFC94|nr:transposase [Pseudomonas fluorescens]
MRKSYSSEFKLKAASMVLDEGQPVTEVCATLDIGPHSPAPLGRSSAKRTLGLDPGRGQGDYC